MHDWDAPHKCHCHKLTVKEINEQLVEKNVKDDVALAIGFSIALILSATFECAWILGVF